MCLCRTLTTTKTTIWSWVTSAELLQQITPTTLVTNGGFHYEHLYPPVDLTACLQYFDKRSQKPHEDIDATRPEFRPRLGASLTEYSHHDGTRRRTSAIFARQCVSSERASRLIVTTKQPTQRLQSSPSSHATQPLWI